MDQIIEKLFVNAPGPAAIVIVVLIFTKFIKSQRRQDLAFFTQLHEDHLDARKLTREAIKENSAALQGHMVAMQRYTDSLETLAQSVASCAIRSSQHNP